MICTSVAAKAVLGTVVACSGFTGAAHATDWHKTTTVKVEVKAPVKVFKKVVIVKSQKEVVQIALKQCAGTVKKVEKNGDNYTIAILGSDNNLHIYQVNDLTGNYTLLRTVISQKDVVQIALKQCAGTVKKVEKNGDNYTITILGSDNNLHVYQVNDLTGNYTLLRTVISQKDAVQIALKQCAGTVKKVEKNGDNYTITILGSDNNLHVYQVNDLTGNYTLLRTVNLKPVQPVIVKSQKEVVQIALKHCAGTVKKVEKVGHIYTITILGADHHDHVYQVNEQTGACGCK